MAVKYSEKAIKTISGMILRAKAGDNNIRNVIVQEMDAETVDALGNACVERGLFGRFGWSAYRNIGDLADRLFSAGELIRGSKITGVDADGYIKLSVGFERKLGELAAVREAFLIASHCGNKDIEDAIAEKKAEFVAENNLLVNPDYDGIAFRTKEDEEAYVSRRSVFVGDIQRWKDDFESEVRLTFEHMRDGLTGDEAVVRTKPTKYKSPVYVSVHKDGKVIEWIYKTGMVSMCDSDGVELRCEKMKPIDAWTENASSSAAKEYIKNGGTFSKYIPQQV